MNKTAVVFGATGLTGKELIFELLEDKRYDRIRSVVRRTLTLSHPSLEQTVVSDFKNLDQYASQLQADVYFCCLGTTIRQAGSQKVFRETDLDLPVVIAALAEKLSIPALVIISSIGADASSSNFYLQTKGLMEKQVAACYHGNLKFVRPSLILGHRGEFRLVERIAAVVAPVLGVFLVGPLKKYRAIPAWDLARGMIHAADQPKEKVIISSDELQQMARKTQRPNHKPMI